MFDLRGFVMQHLQLGRSGLVWSSSRDGIRGIHVQQHYGVAASLGAVATA